MKDFPTVIAVVAAALIDPRGAVLMQQRRPDRAHGGLWEFPGGKVEAAETGPEALVRELAEELGIAVAAQDLTHLADAVQADGALVISLYTCRVWSGDPRCLDAQALQWCASDQLLALSMPPLDVPLAKQLQNWIKEAK